MNEVDKCILMRNINKNYVILSLYVKDIFMLCSNDYIIKFTKRMLTNKFDIKDFGVIDVIH